MPRNWESITNNDENCPYAPDDFRRAMYQLVCQQCLYLRFPQHAKAYRLITAYESYFREALDLLGLRLIHKIDREFLVVIQTVARPQRMSKAQTLFLLVLRQAYHLRASIGDVANGFGDVIYNIPEFEDLYREMTGLTLVEKSLAPLRDLLRDAAQHGLARETQAPDGDPQPFEICILPGIVEVLDENTVGRFGAALKAELAVSSSETLSEGEGISPENEEMDVEEAMQ
ncbi:DUF4194 domain-containing protein [Azospira sp. I09]|uniref:DUF4194 domain-containing protein n=1 Tax=Azospira sp. I09 TaxID=1765049 RepID=UPI00129F2634|nr:DUF4194 domain-containing protein [Azospira sp. I09]BBN89452.1 hypothetical protein AZSP09_24750 [Azospira sp. I09]